MVGWNEEDQKTRLIKFGVTHYELPGAQLKKIACPIRPPVIFQDADKATVHWGLEPIRRPKAGTGARSARPKAGTGLHWGHGVLAEGRHWPALGHGVPAEGLHWGTECPAEGRHWPALGARRSAGLPAEGRR